MPRTLKALSLTSDRPCVVSFAGKTARVIVFVSAAARFSVDVKGMTVGQAAKQITTNCVGVTAHATREAAGMQISHLRPFEEVPLKAGVETIFNLKAPSGVVPSDKPPRYAILIDPNDPEDLFAEYVEHMVPRSTKCRRPKKETETADQTAS
jgi:hypothetical protein